MLVACTASRLVTWVLGLLFITHSAVASTNYPSGPEHRLGQLLESLKLPGFIEHAPKPKAVVSAAVIT